MSKKKTKSGVMVVSVRTKKKKNTGQRSKINKNKTVVALPKAQPLSKAALEHICSITDPFCAGAVGSKYMDFGSVKSLAYPVHGRFSLTTNATGQASVLLFPSYTYFPWIYATTMAASVATFTGAMTAGGNLANVDTVRVVSMGVKIRSIVAPLSASGIVRIRGFAPKNTGNFSSIGITTFNCDYYEDVPINFCKEVDVILRRTDPTAKNWRTLAEMSSTANGDGQILPGFGALMISVDGGPVSLASLDIEYFVNWEVVIDDSNALAQVQTSSPSFNPTVSTAIDIVSSTARNIFTNGANQVAGYIEKEAKSALSSLLSAKMSRIAANAGRVAMLVD